MELRQAVHTFGSTTHTGGAWPRFRSMAARSWSPNPTTRGGGEPTPWCPGPVGFGPGGLSGATRPLNCPSTVVPTPSTEPCWMRPGRPRGPIRSLAPLDPFGPGQGSYRAVLSSVLMPCAGPQSTPETSFPVVVGWHPWFRRELEPGVRVKYTSMQNPWASATMWACLPVNSFTACGPL